MHPGAAARIEQCSEPGRYFRGRRSKQHPAPRRYCDSARSDTARSQPSAATESGGGGSNSAARCTQTSSSQSVGATDSTQPRAARSATRASPQMEDVKQQEHPHGSFYIPVLEAGDATSVQSVGSLEDAIERLMRRVPEDCGADGGPEAARCPRGGHDRRRLVEKILAAFPVVIYLFLLPLFLSFFLSFSLSLSGTG